MTNAPSPPPGWYPDPYGVPRQAYWDGQQWHNVAPPPPPQKTSWKLVAGVIAAVVALAAVYGAITEGDKSPGSVFGPDLAPMNSTVSDGKFSFRATGVERSQGAGLVKPRGEFLVVAMTVTNTGKEAQTFFANNHKLFDAQGREFKGDATAAAWVNSEGWIADLNPGFAINVKVPFDVPPGTQPDRIELHDSAFSQGVSVKLN